MTLFDPGEPEPADRPEQHRLGLSFSAASDIRVGWPACPLWKADE